MRKMSSYQIASHVPIIRSCRESPLKDVEVYEPWILDQKETESENDSESDSAFQNLFKMIEMNEFDISEDEENTETTAKSSSKKLPGKPRMKPIEVPIASIKKSRTGLIRPTLFMKSESTVQERRKSAKAFRNSTSASLSGSGNLAALRILFLQNTLVENVLPIYRKKDRVYLPITPGEFNRCHKSEAIKVANRVKRILNRNYIYLNDRDIAEDLENKFDKLFQDRIKMKTKQIRDNWKLVDPYTTKDNLTVDNPAVVIKKSGLDNQLDFNMPHRNFETDITKYVKRLRELADILISKSSQSGFNKDDEEFETEISIEKKEIQRRNVEYLLIPTIETYNKSKKGESDKDLDEEKEESVVTEPVLNVRRSSFWKTITDTAGAITRTITTTKSINTISEYFGIVIGGQDKSWAPHYSCGSCRSTLEGWLRKI